MTDTRSTAASGTATVYHMLLNPIAPVHDGSGLASSGPVEASPHSDAGNEDVLRHRERCPAGR